LIYLYTWLGILAISLPVAVVYWRAIKRGKSTRTTVFFVVPYFALLALVFLLIGGVRGFALLIWMLVVIAFLLLAFYVYTEVLDVGHGLRRK